MLKFSDNSGWLSVHDRLGVRTSCSAVVASSHHVRIDDDRIAQLAQDLMYAGDPPGWDTEFHFRDHESDERTAMWLLVLDALNFCFWSDDPAVRWRVSWQGELVDGYTALVAALTMAMERGYPLHDASWLSRISETDVADMLAPEPGNTIIPLMDARVNNLRELGRGLLDLGAQPAMELIQSAHGSAIDLVQIIVKLFPSFNDITIWPYADTGLPGSEVRFYKRAQILVGDLAGGLHGSALVEFHDLNQLTAFADYKVPQILRLLGVLIYDEELAALVDTRSRIPAGDRMEIEIRAATIIAVDRLVAALTGRGRIITAAQLDWLLWSRSQHLPRTTHPYHLTETIYY